MATKPTEFPDWANNLETDPTSGQPNRDQPPTDKQDSGYDFEESPPRQWINWKFWNIGNWTRWFEQRDDELAASINDLTQEESVELNGDFDAGQFARFKRAGEVVSMRLRNGTSDITVSGGGNGVFISNTGLVPSWAVPPEKDVSFVYKLDVANDTLFEVTIQTDGAIQLRTIDSTSGLSGVNNIPIPPPNVSYQIDVPITAP